MTEGKKKLFGFVFLMIILASGWAMKTVKEKLIASMVTQREESSKALPYQQHLRPLTSQACAVKGQTASPGLHNSCCTSNPFQYSGQLKEVAAEEKSAGGKALLLSGNRGYEDLCFTTSNRPSDKEGHK